MGRFRDVELDDVELTGDRLLLRPWQPADADAVYAIMADQSKFEFLALPRPYTRHAATDYVTRLGHEGRADGTGLGSAVVDRQSGRVVGSAALRRLDVLPELGYWVAPEARGRGYATEATCLLADWAFAHGVHRVELRCDVANLASAVTALNSGFGYEGVARGYPHRGQNRDTACFARLATDSGVPIEPRFRRLGPAELTDGTLTLRPMTPGDLAGWTDQELDELTLQWAFTGPPRRESVEAVPGRAGLDWLVGNIARFTIEDVASRRFAGSAQLRVSGLPQVGGIGYAVHPAFRGRGYTTRALRLLVRWAFESAGFVRLELGAKTANIASQKAAAAAGFEPDGVREQRLRNPDGSFSDEVRYVLLRRIIP
jgi:RimJ/RimL family protein N-acetyltransferase